MHESHPTKIKDVISQPGGSAFSKYRAVCYGQTGLLRLLLAEFIMLLCGNIPGALGLVMRKFLYPSLFRECGPGVVFGKGITLRHAHKISLGSGVMLDDNCVIDAKGENNSGINLGNDVYVGRNTIVYCKNGDISIDQRSNLSSNCQVFSSNSITIGAGCMIGAYSYFLSGGEYDYLDPTPFCEQNGMNTKGKLTIGANCWFGARVTVLDAASIGDHCVIAAGAVVNKPVPHDSLAAGVPARIIKTLAPTHE